MNKIRLDRMAVDGAATSPERAAAEIHRQLGAVAGPVPVFDIAQALDIEDIQLRPLSGFEAMLLTGPERNFGHVVLNEHSNTHRRRYSLAHELGHFLCAWHQPTLDNGFACRGSDLASPSGPLQHVRQEREANVFAIELLAPALQVRPYLRRLPDLDIVLDMQVRFDISKVAAARRYVSLHSQSLAVVVAKDGTYLYADRSPSFPFLNFESGDHLPMCPRPAAGYSTSDMVEAEPHLWRLGVDQQLFCQTLAQDGGYSLILLHLEQMDD